MVKLSFNSIHDDNGKLVTGMSGDELLAYSYRCSVYLDRCKEAGATPGKEFVEFCISIQEQIVLEETKKPVESAAYDGLNVSGLAPKELAHYEQECVQYQGKDTNTETVRSFCDEVNEQIVYLAREANSIRGAFDLFSKEYHRLKAMGIILPPIYGTPHTEKIMACVNAAREVKEAGQEAIAINTIKEVNQDVMDRLRIKANSQ